MRPLTLHISALTDSEYTLYTRVLKELLDTDQLNLDDAEKLRVSVREARAWIRGRYKLGGAVDTILRFFSPGLEAGDTISGGELFAVLRMVVHVEQGKEVERGLAFVQAFPTDDTETEATGKKPPIPRRPTVISLPSSTTITESTNPFTAALPTDPHFSHPHPHPQPPPQHPRRSTEIQPPLPQPPSSSSASLPASAPTTGRSEPKPLPPPVPTKPTEVNLGTHTHNPFVRASTTRSEDGAANKLPPLPPRKPTRANSTIHIASSKPPNVPPKPAFFSNSTTSTPSPIPTPPAKPAKSVSAPHGHGHGHGHSTSTLMRQSLQASKAAQSMKRAQEMLERERNVEVLRRSGTSIAPPPPPPRNRSQSPSKFSSVSSSAVSSASASSGTGARARASTWERQNEISSAGAPPLPRRPGPSPPLSESSLMQVALARVPSHPSSLRSSPYNLTTPLYNQNQPANTNTNTDSRASSPSPSSLASLDLQRPPKHPDREKKALGLTFGDRLERGEWDKVYGSATGAMSTPASTTTFYSSLQSATPTADQSTFSAQDSPTARVFRSRSMHVPGSNESSPREVITPPPRRRRPESVQVLPGSSSGGLARHVSLQQHHRRSSSTDVNTFPPPLHNLQNPSSPSLANPFSVGTDNPFVQRLTTTLETLQPKLDKARYKAEAGLSRRGFVPRTPGGRGREEVEGLVKGSSEEGWDEWDRRGGMDVYAEPDVDEFGVGEEGGGTIRPSANGTRRDDFWISQRDLGGEKDNLKLPAGDGWKLL